MHEVLVPAFQSLLLLFSFLFLANYAFLFFLLFTGDALFLRSLGLLQLHTASRRSMSRSFALE